MKAIDIKIDKKDLARLSKKIKLLKKESTTELSKKHSPFSCIYSKQSY